MTLSSLQRADVLYIAPHMFLCVIAVPDQRATTEPKILFRPLEGGATKAMTLAEFNALYPEARIEYTDPASVYHVIKPHGVYRSASGMTCHVIKFTVDPQDIIALVHFHQADGYEEIISTDEFRELFPNEVLNAVH